MIISATRRTDIPSFYGEWFINRLKEGYVLIQNPYNENRYSWANLSREAVDIILFWTKNPLPFFKYLDTIEDMKYPYCFHFTLTPYGKDVEKGLPNKQDLIESFITLSKRIGKNNMIWRYDPIFLDDKHTIEYHKKMFSNMAKQLAPYANRCIVSFIDNYKNVMTRMGKDPTYNMTTENMHSLAEVISNIAKEHSLPIFTCAEKIDVSKFGIVPGACIDKSSIEDILQAPINCKRDKNQRDECLCIESIDIGTYNCCANGCNYCYALQSEESSINNMKKHNPLSPVLIGEVNPNAIITGRESKSIIENQLNLF